MKKQNTTKTATKTFNTFHIPVTETKYEGTTVASDHVLAMAGTYNRFGIGGVPVGKAGRQVFQGPMVDGPWAYAYGKASVISANPEMSTGAEIRRNKAENKEHEVHEGDHIVFDGVEYEIVFTNGFGGKHGRLEFIKLVAVNR